MDIFENSAIVVAHPDDEVLWMSSILRRVEEIYICFSDYPPLPALGEGRRKALAEYPLDNVACLEVRESESFNCADWEQPCPSDYGVVLHAAQAKKKRYQENYFLLYELLGQRLAGAGNVFTHNPWGEYGHEEHVQVYRVIRRLQDEMGFNLWFSNYVSQRSFPLMLQYLDALDGMPVVFNADVELAAQLSALYGQNRCWTWPEDYRWPQEEAFYRLDYKTDRPPTAAAHTLNMIVVDLFDGQAAKPGIMDRIRRRIRKK